MTFIEQMREISHTAGKYIKDRLDVKGSILLYTPIPKEGEEGFDSDIHELDYEKDEYEDCIRHEYQGKHGYMYQYYLTKMYKDQEGYFITGLDEDDSERREFELLEISSWEIAAIADYLIENKL